MKSKHFSMSLLKIASVIAIGMTSLQVSANTDTPTENDDTTTMNDIVSQLKSESKGLGRTRFGIYGALGYQGATNSDTSPKIQGLLIDGGAYVLVNPIKKLVDIEVGASVKYNTGMEMKSQNTGGVKYYNGLGEATIYAGPVVRVGNKSAIGFGVSKALYLKEVKGDKNDKSPKNDFSNGLGAYVEYQWDGMKKEGSRYTIPFARLSVEKMDIEKATSGEKSNQTVVGLVFGSKY